MTLKPSLYVIIISLHLFMGFRPLKANNFKDSVETHIPKSLAINLSSRGYGVEAGFKFKKLPHIGFRFNANYFGFKQSQKIEMDEGTSVEIFPDIKTFALGGLVDYYPFKRRVFRLTGGLSFDAVQNYRIAFSSSTGLNLGGLLIASDDFGNINLRMKWNALRPYIGFGFGRAIMKKRLGVGFDMGVSYMGSPKLSLIYEGFLETTTIDEEIKGIEANMKGYSFYPYLSLQLRYNTYSIKK